MFTMSREANVARTLNYLIETEVFSRSRTVTYTVKVAGTNISETMQDRDVVTTDHE